MGVSQKQKGGRGELEAARILSAWWLANAVLLEAKAADLPLRRTPGSGGWTKGSGLGGDLVPVTEDAEDFRMWSVEVKNQECWQFDNILKPNKKAWDIDQYWEQCKEAADASNAWPLLMFTKNFHPWYVCVSRSVFRALHASRKRFEAGPVPPTHMSYAGRVYLLADDFTRSFSREICVNAFGE